MLPEKLNVCAVAFRTVRNSEGYESVASFVYVCQMRLVVCGGGKGVILVMTDPATFRTTLH